MLLINVIPLYNDFIWVEVQEQAALTYTNNYTKTTATTNNNNKNINNNNNEQC